MAWLGEPTPEMDGKAIHRGSIEPLDPTLVAIYQKMAGEYGSAFVQTQILSHLSKILGLSESTEDALVDKLEEPRSCLLAFYSHYAFARRGRDRDDLAHLARTAFNRVTEGVEFDTILAADTGVALWDAFDAACQEQKRNSNEGQNRGLMQGILELAQEIYRIDQVGCLSGWVIDGIDQTGRLEPQFLRIVDIRGVGPKITATFLRDMIALFDAENSIDAIDKIYIQPVDRWLRLITPYVVPEPEMDDIADWIVAGKITKYARRAGVSGVRFNMGSSYFGQRIVKVPERFDEAMKSLIGEERNGKSEPF